MDRQEAIKGLKNLFSEHELSLPNTDSLEILNMAIAALEKEDAEEQGLIVRLPCKIRSKVYTVQRSFVPQGCLWGKHMVCTEKYIIGERLFHLWMLGDIGKSIFLTREEAEQSVKKMEGGE